MKKLDKDPLRTVQDSFDDIKHPTRKIMERGWFRNSLYVMGEQYLEWVVSTSTFRKKTSNSFVPTPVANIMRDYVRSMRGLILNRDFAIRVWPNSNEIQDRQAALVGEKLLRHMDAEDDESFADEMISVADQAVIFGTSFMRTFPSKDNISFGYSGKDMIFTEVVNQSVLPFMVFVDEMGDTLRRKRWAGIKSLKPKEWVEDTFKKKISSSDEDPRTSNYEKRLMRMVATTSPWKGKGLESQIIEEDDSDLVVFKEMEVRPYKGHEDGRYLAIVGNTLCVDVNRMPIPVTNGKWEYSLTDFHYNKSPGRFWGDGGVNDLISPQNSINSIDQAFEMNRKGLGRPVIWMPSGAQMERMNQHGLSFIAIKYDAHTTGGAKPSIEKGTPLPQQFLEERAVHRSTIQDSEGDPKNILKGQSPGSKASGVMVDILRETAESSHLPDVKRFYRSLKRVYRKRLILAQDVFTEDRMIKAGGIGSGISVMYFKGSDLRGNTDVKLEMAPGATKTNAGVSDTILKLVESGFLKEAETDVIMRKDIINRIGITALKSEENVDAERSDLENAKIRAGEFYGIMLTDTEKDENGKPVGEPKVVSNDYSFQFDNHSIHFSTHRKQILSPEFAEWPQEAQVVLLSHCKLHQVTLQQQQQEMMKAQAELENPGKQESQEI